MILHLFKLSLFFLKSFIYLTDGPAVLGLKVVYQVKPLLCFFEFLLRKIHVSESVPYVQRKISDQ